MAELGISENPSSRWQQVADIPKELFEGEIAKAKEAGKPITSEAARRLAERTVNGETAQADFVFWWDTQAEKSKGAAEKRRNRSVTALKAGENGLPDKMTISRWRRALNAPDVFEHIAYPKPAWTQEWNAKHELSPRCVK